MATVEDLVYKIRIEGERTALSRLKAIDGALDGLENRLSSRRANFFRNVVNHRDNARLDVLRENFSAAQLRRIGSINANQFNRTQNLREIKNSVRNSGLDRRSSIRNLGISDVGNGNFLNQAITLSRHERKNQEDILSIKQKITDAEKSNLIHRSKELKHELRILEAEQEQLEQSRRSFAQRVRSLKIQRDKIRAAEQERAERESILRTMKREQFVADRAMRALKNRLSEEQRGTISVLKAAKSKRRNEEAVLKIKARLVGIADKQRDMENRISAAISAGNEAEERRLRLALKHLDVEQSTLTTMQQQIAALNSQLSRERSINAQRRSYSRRARRIFGGRHRAGLGSNAIIGAATGSPFLGRNGLFGLGFTSATNPTSNIATFAGAFLAASATEGLISFNRDLEQIQASLAKTAEDGEDVETTLANVAQVAFDTGSNFKTTGEIFNRFRLATKGLKPEDNPFIKVFGGTSAEATTSFTELLLKTTAGQSGTGIDGALLQFSQSISNDFKASAQELNSIFEQTPGLGAEILAGLTELSGREDIGGGLKEALDAGNFEAVTTGVLKEFGRDGVLSSELILQALAIRGDDISEEFKNFTNNIGFLENQLQTSITMGVVRPFSDGLKFADRYKSVLKSVIGLGTDVERQRRMFNLGEDLGSSIDKFLEINGPRFTTFFTQTMPRIADSLGRVFKPLFSIVGTFFGGIIDGLNTASAASVLAGSSFADWLERLRPLLYEFGFQLGRLLSVITRIADVMDSLAVFTDSRLRSMGLVDRSSQTLGHRSMIDSVNAAKIRLSGFRNSDNSSEASAAREIYSKSIDDVLIKLTKFIASETVETRSLSSRAKLYGPYGEIPLLSRLYSIPISQIRAGRNIMNRGETQEALESLVLQTIDSGSIEERELLLQEFNNVISDFNRLQAESKEDRATYDENIQKSNELLERLITFGTETRLEAG